MSPDFRIAVAVAAWATIIWMSRIFVLFFDFTQFSYVVYASIGVCVIMAFIGLAKPRREGLFFGNKWIWLFIGVTVFAGLHGATHANEIPPWMISEESDYRQPWVYFRTFVLPGVLLLLLSIVISVVYAEGGVVFSLHTAIISLLLLIDLAVIGQVAISGLQLSELALADRDEHLSASGFHSNSLAAILTTGYALILGMWTVAETRRERLFFSWTSVITFLAILLTFSRGVLLPLALCTWLFVSRKSLKTKIMLLIAIAIILFVFQEALLQRLSYGTKVGDTDVSAGRVENIWIPLLPDVIGKFWFGGGIQSILWTDAQQYMEIYPVGRSHNAYLDLLLDVGFVGAFVVLAIYIYIWNGFVKMAKIDPDKRYRGLFFGSQLSLISMALIGLTNERITPASSQVLFWIVTGIMLGRSYWLKKQANCVFH